MNTQNTWPTATGIQSLSDTSLLEKMRRLVKQERELLLEVLHHLKEVKRRRLYSDLGRGSLFDYCVKDLGYSEGATYRRLEALKLIEELPEVEEKIESGKLTLSNIAQVQRFVRDLAKTDKSAASTLSKREIVTQVENKSAREVERFLVAQSPKIVLTKESVRPISETHSQHTVILSKEVLSKLETVRSLLGPKGTTCSLAELISEMATLAEVTLKQKKFGKKNAQQMVVTDSDSKFSYQEPQPHVASTSTLKVAPESATTLRNIVCEKQTSLANRKSGHQTDIPSIDPSNAILQKSTANQKSPREKETIAISCEDNLQTTIDSTSTSKVKLENSATTKKTTCEKESSSCNREVKTVLNSTSTSLVKVQITKTRSKNQRYISANLKALIWKRDGGCCQKCGSMRNLNFDHIMPVAFGGESEPHNLRLLCFSCNGRQWIRNSRSRPHIPS